MNRNQRLEKIAWWTQSFPSHFCCAAAMYPPCGWAVNAYWWANYCHVLQLPFVLMTASLKSLKTEFKYPAPSWTIHGKFRLSEKIARSWNQAVICFTVLGLTLFGCNYPTNYLCLKHLHIQKVKLLNFFPQRTKFMILKHMHQMMLLLWGVMPSLLLTFLPFFKLKNPSHFSIIKQCCALESHF